MTFDSELTEAQRSSWVGLKFRKGEVYRAYKIAELLPKDADSVLDIGPAATQVIFRRMFKSYRTVDLQNADFKMDLLQDNRIPVPDRSFDLVILSHILEHLPFPDRIAREAKRISKKYVYVALPNDHSILARIRFLFGFGSKSAIALYGHKYLFSTFSADKWVLKEFGPWNVRRASALRRGDLYRLTYQLGRLLVRIDENLFASEVAYVFVCQK
ncbi:MAG: class I SAM-dependent methyltransferase [Nitrososphaerota archaeon]|nr:class I SAM-dependent methyltransferase [Nitrososphaerota archaeon]